MNRDDGMLEALHDRLNRAKVEVSASRLATEEAEAEVHSLEEAVAAVSRVRTTWRRWVTKPLACPE
jgi:hypothetical protein